MLSAVMMLGMALAGTHNVICPDRLNAEPDSGVADMQKPADADVTIHNDFYWTDDNGEHIYTRSGCMAQFNGTYYWYGGRQPRFHDQYCYTSTDLVHWACKGVILKTDVEVNRIDVLYNEKTKRYVMFMKYDGNDAKFGIATAEKPEGPFTFKKKMLIDDAVIGDMSMFKDDDGKAYLCYVSWAKGVNAQHGIYRMSDDYLTPEKRIHLWDIPYREAPHMFKRHGIYYYWTSKTALIDSSGTKYYTARKLEGPWSPPKPLETPGSTNSWDTQVDFVFPIKGKRGTLYMYAGDRWIKDAKAGRNGDYVWLPMKFDGDEPVVDYYQDWELNPAQGTWHAFDPARNLAADKPAAASSEQDSHAAGNVTATTTYKDYVNTYWQSTPDSTQWTRVDLGAPVIVNRVILKWNRYAAQTFKVQTSTDGDTWKDVYQTTHGIPYGITDVTFDPTNARYVRVYMTEYAPVWYRPTKDNPDPPIPTGYELFQFMVLND